MSTIPLIFNEYNIKRTILGGLQPNDNETIGMLSEKKTTLSTGIVLLTRSGIQYRTNTLDFLLQHGFSDIVCIENSTESYLIEEISQRYPTIKFVIPQETVSVGDMINIGFEECKTKYILVLWDDIKLRAGFFSQLLEEFLIEEQKFCIAPFLLSPALRFLPVMISPAVKNKQFISIADTTVVDKAKTLYPVDFLGFYNRQKFIQLGGFDHSIHTLYWQSLDFFVRAWLWGEEIKLSARFSLSYEDSPDFFDTTVDYAQLRFFIKNCAPIFSNDHAQIPLSQLFGFSLKYGAKFLGGFSEFFAGRKWVYENRFRFKTDIQGLLNHWLEEKTE